MKSWREVIFSEKDHYSFRPEIYLILMGLMISLVAWVISDINLFGHKQDSIFDIWTITHVATGAVLAYFTISLRSVNFHHPIMLLLLVSFGWEIIEHYIELSDISFLANWFAGEETFLNRLIADQIAVVLGFLLIKWEPRLLFPALLVALAILFVHVWVGDSMFLYQ